MLRDYHLGADRRIDFSMILPQMVFPPTWRGAKGAFRYENWMAITHYVNLQTSYSLPSK